MEEKQYSEATLEDEFSDCTVVIVLNKEASMDFRAFGPEDFPEISVCRVADSTKLTMELVIKQLEAEKTEDWSGLEDHKRDGMLVDVDKFRRILDLQITKEKASKEYVLECVEKLIQRDDVIYAGPDYYFITLLSANHPQPAPRYYSSSNIFRAPRGQMGYFDRLQVPQAWAIETGRSFVRVGVIDSGIDMSHPSLSDRVDRNLSRDFITGGEDGIPKDENGDPLPPPYGLEDIDGHGTAVAGVIGANGRGGVIGVCWNVTLVSLRIFTRNGNGETRGSNLRKIIDFAIGNNIPILNASIGLGDGNDGGSQCAIRNYSGLFVAAAGNDGSNNDARPVFPSNWTANSDIDNIISVGATRHLMEVRNEIYRELRWDLPIGSNWGRTTVDLFAPGEFIFTTVPAARHSGNLSEGYIAINGTSYAAPLVAGVAALLKSRNRLVTTREMKALIENNVERMHDDELRGRLSRTGGRLNAARPLAALAAFGGGTGTLNNPYLISHSVHLENIFLAANRHFRLVNNIVIDTIIVPWTPIPEFRGTFDGNGHTVSGLEIETFTSGNFGLFAQNFGTIRNLNISATVSVRAGGATVGIAAGVNHGVIENVTVLQGSVINNIPRDNFHFQSRAGGIAGFNAASGIIRHCRNRANIFNQAVAGGIAGTNSGGVNQNTNNGEIHYTDFNGVNGSCGGIVGIQTGTNSTMFSNHNHADLRYTGPVSNSTILQPMIGVILGRRQGGQTGGNLTFNPGSVHRGNLRTVGSHDQALFVRTAEIGRIG